MDDFGEFFFDGWPGGPYRLGSLKWAALVFALLFTFLLVLGLLFYSANGAILARLGQIATFSALGSAVVTPMLWGNVLWLRHRKRAPLSKGHRLRQRKGASRSTP